MSGPFYTPPLKTCASCGRQPCSCSWQKMTETVNIAPTPFNEYPSDGYVNCGIICLDANGAPELIFVKVACTKADYEIGTHYKAARRYCGEMGYDPVLAFDGNDPAGRVIVSEPEDTVCVEFEDECDQPINEGTKP